MIVVADASVALKWFLRDAPGEDHQGQALHLLEQAVGGQVQLWQPPHFLAEVAAVLARLKPDQALDDLHDLLQFPLHTAGTPDILARAVALAVQLQHHLFDTLYHAVALQTPGAVCVTADRRYLDKAHPLGRIVWLGDYQHA